MSIIFEQTLDKINTDIYDILYAYNKSDNLPNFIEEHKNLNITPYRIKKLFNRCKNIRKKYSNLFKKFNTCNMEIYNDILENMLHMINNIYDLHYISDIRNVEIEYVNQNKKILQKKLIQLIKNNIFNLHITSYHKTKTIKE